MAHDEKSLNKLAADAFQRSDENPLTETQAFVASHRGEIVFERYADGFGPESTFLSWSMAKSFTSALCGRLIEAGKLSLDDPAPVESWANDERSAITLRQLLQMRSGLRWNEDYVDDAVSDVIEMLFASGKHDTAGYAVACPLADPPGSEFVYSSGTTNIITRIMGDAIGGGSPGFTTALIEDMLTPAGLKNVSIKFDHAETFIGSSFLYATARDYIAFGELFRNDGIGPDGTRLLPAGWVDASVEDVSTCPDSGQGYGLQWWLARDGHGSFAANGYEGQRLQVSQELGLTFVRLGKTSAEHGPELHAFYRAVSNCFT